MSKGPNRVRRIIGETLAAHPGKRFTITELTKLAYPGEPVTRSHLVYVRRMVRRLEATQALIVGQLVDYGLPEKRTVKWVRAPVHEPKPSWV
jgi:hypothetical protein